ncbi:hypothetical protein EJB05_23885 [Eragrostis curvula]|uniref:Uncharacterized protein n=1 Tax=Eragrostis curvula TaxID=38414 RepID=A0A5J9V873_9POAL|nr:hypothetical protein EJB05_23885 [Eragrostis curvula]
MSIHDYNGEGESSFFLDYTAGEAGYDRYGKLINDKVRCKSYLHLRCKYNMNKVEIRLKSDRKKGKKRLV